jgi:iron complex outermembrane receptor protein
MKFRRLTTSLAFLVVASAYAQNNGQGDLTNLSIDQLMNMKVTSASKKSQPLDSAPVAISVVTQSDIHRSGARTLVEALRLIPGTR